MRENAKEKIYHQLGRWKELKKGNPRMIIGVGGCVASADGEEIFRRAPEVDIVFGPQTMHLVPGMIEKVIAGEGRQIDISFPELEKFNILPPIARGAPSAYVTITEGCSNFCTYCIVPFTRGPVVSRTVREIMEEVRRDVDSGVREIHLLGQNVNEFAGLNEDGSESSLAELLYLSRSSSTRSRQLTASAGFASPRATPRTSTTRPSPLLGSSPRSPPTSIFRCRAARTASLP